MSGTAESLVRFDRPAGSIEDSLARSGESGALRVPLSQDLEHVAVGGWQENPDRQQLWDMAAQRVEACEALRTQQDVDPEPAALPD